MALTGPYIFLTDVFVRIAAARAHLTSRGQDGVSVEDLLGEDVTGTARARQQSILEAALSVYRAHYALSDAPERHDSDEEELTAFRHALVGFGRAARETPGVAARYSLDKIARATAPSLHDTYTFDKKRFRADLAQACCSAGMTDTEAQRTARAVAASTRRESSAARARETLVELRERMCATRPRDLLAVCMVCVCWAGLPGCEAGGFTGGAWRGAEGGVRRAACVDVRAGERLREVWDLAQGLGGSSCAAWVRWRSVTASCCWSTTCSRRGGGIARGNSSRTSSRSGVSWA